MGPETDIEVEFVYMYFIMFMMNILSRLHICIFSEIYSQTTVDFIVRDDMTGLSVSVG